MVFTDWCYIGVALLVMCNSNFGWKLVKRIFGINGHLIVYKKNEPLISNYNDVGQIMDVKNVVVATPHLEGHTCKN